MKWIIIFGIALDTFLIMLNGFLHGRLKQHTDIVLGLILFILLLLLFIFYGWLLTLICFLGSFVFGAFVQSLAARIAAQFLKIK